MPRDSPSCKVYVGELPRSAEERDLTRVFKRYGELRSVWVARNPPGFAFVVFEDERCAEKAVRGLDGTELCGGRVRVEISNGRAGNRGGGGGGGSGGGSGRKPFNADDKCFSCGRTGHYAHDCPQRGRRGGSDRGGGDRGRRRSRSPSGSKSSRSRSPLPRRGRGKAKSKSVSRSRSKS